MENCTFGIGRQPSYTTSSRLMTMSVSAVFGIHMRRQRLPQLAGMVLSNSGTKLLCLAIVTFSVVMRNSGLFIETAVFHCIGGKYFARFLQILWKRLDLDDIV